MRIVVLKLGSGEELACGVEVLENYRVGIFNKHACIRSIGSHFALAVNELNKG